MIELAREAQMPYFWQSGEIAHLEQLKRFEALVRADEREECAKVADDQWVRNPNVSGGDAIRARGKTK
jgi:hypothetical protein